jgi:hypothetical protein
MPSPFSGMDPWLEAPGIWGSVHHSLISHIYAELNRTLPDTFAATVSESIYRMAAEEINVPFVQVVEAREPERIVAVVEVLSPINKTGKGREQYLKKQREVLDSAAHLLEIDLLRGGQHTVAVEEMALLQEHRTFWDYLICLHRAGVGERYTCWPVELRESLPTITLPLTESYPDALLDLQALLDACYDTGPFRRLVDYAQPPTPRLKLSDMAWAEEVLRPAGVA